MNVKIIDSTASPQAWYRNKIERIFNVIQSIKYNEFYVLYGYSSHLILKNDCIIMKDEEIKDKIIGFTNHEKILIDKMYKEN